MDGRGHALPIQVPVVGQDHRDAGSDRIALADGGVPDPHAGYIRDGVVRARGEDSRGDAQVACPRALALCLHATGDEGHEHGGERGCLTDRTRRHAVPSFAVDRCGRGGTLTRKLVAAGPHGHSHLTLARGRPRPSAIRPGHAPPHPGGWSRGRPRPSPAAVACRQGRRRSRRARGSRVGGRGG